MSTKYNMIVAADMNWCIGNKGSLLTHLPLDMKFFKAITTKKVVIMGKKTQESLPNGLYLKDRINIVLNQDGIKSEVSPTENNTILIDHDNINTVPNIVSSLNKLAVSENVYYKFNYMTDGDVFVVGGGQIYREFLNRDMIDTIFLTKIHHEFNGDTYIPDLYELGFKVVDTLLPITENKDGIKYEILMLKKI